MHPRNHDKLEPDPSRFLTGFKTDILRSGTKSYKKGDAWFRPRNDLSHLLARTGKGSRASGRTLTF